MTHASVTAVPACRQNHEHECLPAEPRHHLRGPRWELAVLRERCRCSGPHGLHDASAAGFMCFHGQGPQHRQTVFAVKFPRITEADRDAGFGIARHLSKGTLVAASATTTSTRLCTALCTRRTSSINRVPGGRLMREFLFSWTTFSEQ